MLDSFFYHWSVNFLGPVNFAARIMLSALCLFAGMSLEKGAKKVILNQKTPEPHVIDYGVFRYVRHPVYLGVLVILFGLFLWSLSLASLIVWCVFFRFYDWMASYEEQDLTRIFGEDYTNYMKRVRKWVPVIQLRKKGV